MHPIEEQIFNLRKIANEQVKCADDYSKARRAAGEAETELNLILAANLSEIRAEKSNVGIDMAHLMLCERNKEALGLYRTWKKNESIYKGLEKLLDARSSKLIFEQSLMKHSHEGAKWGTQ